MNPATPKKYYTDRDKAYEQYRANNNYNTSEYMEQDFLNGYDYGYTMAILNDTEERHLREKAAIAAMQGMLASCDHIYDSDMYLKSTASCAVRQADALITELNQPKQ